MEPSPRPTLTSGGALWGARRVRHGISIRQLSRASGVAKSLLSYMEHGRMIPTGPEYERIARALDDLIATSTPLSPTEERAADGDR